MSEGRKLRSMDERGIRAPGLCPSAMKLDAALLFGVDADMAEHLKECPRCAAERREIEHLDREFETDVLPKTIDAVVFRVLSDRNPDLTGGPRVFGRGIARRRAPANAATSMVAVAASIAAVVGFLFWKSPVFVTNHNTETIGDKGALGLEIWCKRDDAVFRVHQGARLMADDMIRFVPRFTIDDGNRASDEPLYLMVVSVDGNGTVSRYFPANSDAAQPVKKSGEPLPGSTILDEAPGPERVWLLASDEEFYFRDIQRAALDEWRRAGSADRMGAIPTAAISAALDQASLVFTKEGDER